MSKIKIVGVSSYARAGKNSLCQLLQHQLFKKNKISKIVSLARPLRQELADFCKTKWNVDIFNLSAEQKKITRPLMVATAEINRFFNENHYVDLLHDEICESLFLKNEKIDLFIIDDLRYPNEADYVKKLGGKIVYVEKYDMNDFGEKIVLGPPNDIEAENGPQVRAQANYFVSWENQNYNNISIEELDNILGPHVDSITESLIKKLL